MHRRARLPGRSPGTPGAIPSGVATRPTRGAPRQPPSGPAALGSRRIGAAEQLVKDPQMAKERVPIPDDLTAEVMFASDRSCCVCRLERHKVQIHHIDEDPSNNTLENLAVICLHCHSDAHTTGAFVRNLTPELIRLYNSSWRDIVKLRLRPSGELPGQLELASEAFLEASLDCHRWKVWFMSLAGPTLPDGKGAFMDVWDVMAELWIPKYAEDTYRRFLPLFIEGLREVQGRFDRLIQLFPDVLPPDFRSLLVRAHRQLEVERSVYAQLPALVGGGVIAADQVEAFFYGRFVEVVRVLRDVSRDADRRRESLAGAQRGAEPGAPPDRGGN